MDESGLIENIPITGDWQKFITPKQMACIIEHNYEEFLKIYDAMEESKRKEIFEYLYKEGDEDFAESCIGEENRDEGCMGPAWNSIHQRE